MSTMIQLRQQRKAENGCQICSHISLKSSTTWRKVSHSNNNRLYIDSVVYTLKVGGDLCFYE